MIHLSLTFLILIVMNPSVEADGINCNEFEATILEKINKGYREAMNSASANLGCPGYPTIAQNNGQKIGQKCIAKIAEASEFCANVSYKNVAESNAGKGASNTSGKGTVTVNDQAQSLSEQGKQCGSKLATIPDSCRTTAKSNRETLVYAGCLPEDIKKSWDKALEMAPPQIMKYCNAVSDHYDRTKNNIKVKGAADRNFKGTNTNTLQGIGGGARNK